jgi:hypothetical protein
LPEAYIRYINGQYGVKINEFHELDQVHFEALEYFFPVKGMTSMDDFYIRYNEESDVKLIDKQEVELYMNSQRLVKSEIGAANEVEPSPSDGGDAPPKEEIKRANKISNSLSKLLGKVFISNSYIASLFPNLKIQKPGYDFYSPIVLIQLVIVVYTVMFYTVMDASGSSIIQ